jgi:regulator of protease activity HflC (stomatin/prohibitin superfamily)
MRDALNKICGSMPVEYVYGEGKGKMIDSVSITVKNHFKETGIVIDKIYLIGSIRIPESVKSALDSKVKMTQEAQRAENEVAKAKAEADIAIAKATGRAKSILVEAQAQAEANKLISNSITPTLVQYKTIEVLDRKWNGAYPTTMLGGNSIPMLSINK